MATTYDSVYDRFLFKITDYELASLIDTDLENQLLKYLKSAITDFKYCTKNLTDRNDSSQTFNIDLTETEQEILAKFMLVHWINPNILRLENIRDHVGSKDFSVFSPGNFLDKLKSLKTDLYNEAVSDMNFYYYATP
jgi:hypothetical protein